MCRTEYDVTSTHTYIMGGPVTLTPSNGVGSMAYLWLVDKAECVTVWVQPNPLHRDHLHSSNPILKNVCQVLKR